MIDDPRSSTECGAAPASQSEISYAQGIDDERDRIRTELIDWLTVQPTHSVPGSIKGRRIADEIDRICPPD